MSLRERFGLWLAGKSRAATQAVDTTPTVGRYFGPGLGYQPPHEVLLRELVGLPDALTRAIANRVSSLNPLVKTRRRVTSGTEKDETLDDHPLKRLLDRPHPNLSRRQLFRLTAQWIVTVGESYWLKVGSGLGIPVELHPIPPARVWPVVARNVVQGYELMDGNGRRISLPAEMVVRIFWNDPASPWQSRGYMGPQALEVDTHKFATEHLRSHYQHDATPKTALEAGEGADAFTDDQKKAFLAAWRAAYHTRTGDSVGLPGLVPYGYKLIEMAAQTGSEMTPLLEYLRDDLFMGYGVPRSVLGQAEAGDRSTAETNAYVFDRHAIEPLASMMADALTLQLAADFEGEVFVEFEDFIARDKDFELRREVADLEHGVRIINKVLSDRDDDPVPWGEEPLVSSKLKPLSKLGEEPAPAPGEPEAGAVSEDDLAEAEERMERALHIAVRQQFRASRRARRRSA